MPPDTASASISQKPTVQPQVAQFLTPNFYQLAGDGIHFSLRTEGFRAPFVNYQDATRTLTFSGDQVRLVDVPDLGTVVSVTLLLTPDAGSTTFSVLLPQVNLPISWEPRSVCVLRPSRRFTSSRSHHNSTSDNGSSIPWSA